MRLKTIARELLPPVITKTLRPPTKYGPWGRYPTWEAAAAASGPYRSNLPPLLENVRETQVGLHEPPCFHGTHLAALLSLPEPRPAKVLDFGGGLALGYFRARRVVPTRIKWWRVVDLPDVVEAGRKLPRDPDLSFSLTIEEALNGETPDIVTCSSVLQCMEDSYGALEKLFSLGASRIVLDRIPLEREERYSVFHTVSGDKIPWRIISRDRLQTIARHYHLTFEQTLPHHPSAPDASDEYCLFYSKDRPDAPVHLA